MSHTKEGNHIKLLRLNSQEIEMITGCLLGDGMLVKSGKLFRFRVEHTVRHREYVEWKYNILKRLCIFSPTHDLSHKSVKFGTVGHPELTAMRQAWYSAHKHLPSNFKLTPLRMAVWFMDDGTKHRDTVDFSIHSFSPDCQTVLQEQMEKFGIHTSVNSDSKGARLYVIKRSYPIFKSLVNPFIVKCMAYKLP